MITKLKSIYVSIDPVWTVIGVWLAVVVACILLGTCNTYL